jgi:hypothetical protein
MKALQVGNKAYQTFFSFDCMQCHAAYAAYAVYAGAGLLDIAAVPSGLEHRMHKTIQYTCAAGHNTYKGVVNKTFAASCASAFPFWFNAVTLRSMRSMRERGGLCSSSSERIGVPS